MKLPLSISLFFAFLFYACQPANSVDGIPKIKITPLQSPIDASFRGIASLGANTIWLGGTKGTAIHSEDGGQTWKKSQLYDADSLDFRDIELLDANTILLMSIGTKMQSRIYKTKDGGITWRTVLINTKEKAFFNGMDFWDKQSGVLVSDPIDDKLFVLRTDNGGETWQRIGETTLPILNPTEYGFAASGTGVVTKGNGNIWIATGGNKARVFHSPNRGDSWTVCSTPMADGNASSGIFSISFRDTLNGIAVGGDYQAPDAALVTINKTTDGGKKWEAINSEASSGHKACVQYLGGQLYLSAGRTGVAWSADDGLTWEALSETQYYCVSFDEESRVGYMAGPNGNVAKFELTFE